jgi:hypothetical protein
MKREYMRLLGGYRWHGLLFFVYLFLWAFLFLASLGRLLFEKAEEGQTWFIEQVLTMWPEKKL